MNRCFITDIQEDTIEGSISTKAKLSWLQDGLHSLSVKDSNRPAHYTFKPARSINKTP